MLKDRICDCVCFVWSKVDDSVPAGGVYAILTSAAQHIPNETWNEWLERQRTIVRKEALALGADAGLRLTTFNKCNTNGLTVKDLLVQMDQESLWPGDATVTTVHKVKGDEFDTVIFYVPKPRQAKHCPTVQWWSDDPLVEEGRVAFVAASRAKKRFVLCIHESTHKVFDTAKKDFLALFGRVEALR